MASKDEQALWDRVCDRAFKIAEIRSGGQPWIVAPLLLSDGMPLFDLREEFVDLLLDLDRERCERQYPALFRR